MLAIKRIRLINFQSHEDSEICLGEGLNVIIGGSDQGKTAIIRALRWLLYNEPRGTDFIRIGADSCKVIITLTDGVEISRERTQNRNIYTLKRADGEEQIYEGFGNETPEEITNAHGMGKVNLDTDIESSLNIGYQLDGPFLLSQTGAIRAKAIGRIVGIHLIDKAIRNVIRDLHQLNQEEKFLNSGIETLNNELSIYSDLDNEGELLNQADSLLNKLEQELNRLDKLKAISGKIELVDGEIKEQQKTISEFRNIAKIELMLEKIIVLSQRYNWFSLLQEREGVVRGHLEKLRLILTNTVNIFEAEQCLNQLHQNYFPKKEHFKGIKMKYDLIRSQVNEHKLLLSKLDTIKEAEQFLESLSGNYKRKLKIQELKQRRDQVQENIEKGKKYLANNEKEIKELINKYNAVLKRVGRCPLCYSKINEEIGRMIAEKYKKEVGFVNES